MPASNPNRAGEKQQATSKDVSDSGASTSGGELDATFVPDGSTKPAELDATIIHESPETTETAPNVQKPKPEPPTSDAKSKKKVTQLGDFKLVKKLGQGGMGTVYLAKQVSLDRKVALKTLSKEFVKKPDFVKRFIREARAMAKLQHQNIVQVYAADSQQGVHFAAIEFIDGMSMQDWIGKLKKLSIADALHVILVCADALQHAHELNMIHRDIKPDNILVTSKGVVKVADFGLAKVLDEDMSVTQSGTGLGTPLYMAPEQARNAKHVDQRTDIYALGVTLYYFVTGELPFTGGNTLEVITAKETGKFTPAAHLNREIPERLDLMIDKMMSKNPDHRYIDCGQLIADIEGLDLAGPSLSFIEQATGTAATRSRLGSSAGKTTSAPKRAAVGVTSAEDAARTEVKTEKVDTGTLWFVQHTNAKGEMTISKLSTAQIQQGVKGEMIDFKAKAKKSKDGTFLPLAQYAEFSSLMEKRAIKAKADARSTYVKDTYAEIDKQEMRRRRWRWLRNLTDNIKGGISLILWLAFVAGVLFALFKWGLPFIKDMIAK